MYVGRYLIPAAVAALRDFGPSAGAAAMIGNNNIHIIYALYRRRIPETTVRHIIIIATSVGAPTTRFGFVYYIIIIIIIVLRRTRNKCSQRGAFDYEECRLYNIILLYDGINVFYFLFYFFII